MTIVLKHLLPWQQVNANYTDERGNHKKKLSSSEGKRLKSLGASVDD